MIYEPREDSHLLENEVAKCAKGRKVLDIGSGSGIQAKAALKSGAKSVLCADIGYEVIKFLKKKGLDAIQSDLFENVNEKFDLIVFNPPYLPYDEREDSESARTTSGGKRGDEIIARFLKDAKKHLNDKGIILLVVSSLTPLEKINKILDKQGFRKEVVGEKKLFMERLWVWKIDI